MNLPPPPPLHFRRILTAHPSPGAIPSKTRFGLAALLAALFALVGCLEAVEWPPPEQPETAAVAAEEVALVAPGNGVRAAAIGGDFCSQHWRITCRLEVVTPIFKGAFHVKFHYTSMDAAQAGRTFWISTNAPFMTITGAQDGGKALSLGQPSAGSHVFDIRGTVTGAVSEGYRWRFFQSWGLNGQELGVTPVEVEERFTDFCSVAWMRCTGKRVGTDQIAEGDLVEVEFTIYSENSFNPGAVMRPADAYVNPSDSVTFPAFQAHVPITFTIRARTIDDNVVGPDRPIRYQMVTPGGMVRGTVTVGTVVDDDMTYATLHSVGTRRPHVEDSSRIIQPAKIVLSRPVSVTTYYWGGGAGMRVDAGKMESKVYDGQTLGEDAPLGTACGLALHLSAHGQMPASVKDRISVRSEATVQCPVAPPPKACDTGPVFQTPIAGGAVRWSMNEAQPDSGLSVRVCPPAGATHLSVTGVHDILGAAGKQAWPEGFFNHARTGETLPASYDRRNYWLGSSAEKFWPMVRIDGPAIDATGRPALAHNGNGVIVKLVPLDNAQPGPATLTLEVVAGHNSLSPPATLTIPIRDDGDRAAIGGQGAPPELVPVPEPVVMTEVDCAVSDEIATALKEKLRDSRDTPDGRAWRLASPGRKAA